MRILLVVLVVACSSPSGPFVNIIPDGSGMRDEYALGLDAWRDLGFVAGDSGIECPRYWYASGDADCTITVWISRWPNFRERYGVDAAADRETRGIVIDERYSGHLLVHLAAHELGHVLLDAGHLGPGERGIMDPHTAETIASAADYALACASIGVCH
jgi:hypothetical protein